MGFSSCTTFRCLCFLCLLFAIPQFLLLFACFWAFWLTDNWRYTERWTLGRLRCAVLLLLVRTSTPGDSPPTSRQRQQLKFFAFSFTPARISDPREIFFIFSHPIPSLWVVELGISWAHKIWQQLKLSCD